MEKKETTLENNRKLINKVSSTKLNKGVPSANPKDTLEVVLDDSEEVSPENKSTKIKIDKEKIEITDEVDTSRRKRRRSSANNE